MTRYAARPKAYPLMPDYHDSEVSMILEGYDYQPARPNPDASDGEAYESYRPVTLVWEFPDSPVGTGAPIVAANDWRGNRSYAITSPGAVNVYGVRVNGIHIPVQFGTVRDAMRFAQHIEDTNTED